jgi:peptidoglycan hydrolase-like protein with peptidoglycan-binding domain
LPALEGNDVRAVQKALAAAGLTAPQSGVYVGGTAAAVVQFQKKSGLNADGVVNAVTRQKLGVKPEPAPPGGTPKQPPGRKG